MAEDHLSVILANYNHAQYLEESVTAIFAQTRPPDEVIVVDDASNDESLAVLSDLRQRYVRLRVICNPMNLGVIEASLVGLRHANGSLVCFTAADDPLLPGFFEKAVSLLEQSPSAGGCFGWTADHVAEDGSCLYSSPPPIGVETARYYSPSEIRDLIRLGFSAGFRGCVLRVSALLDAGGIIEDLQWYSDWFAVLTIGLRNGLCLIPDAVAIHRVSPQSFSATGNRRALRDAGRRVLALLESPDYDDVRGGFRAGAFNNNGMDMVRVLLLPNNWHWLSFPYCRLRAVAIGRRLQSTMAHTDHSPELKTSKWRSNLSSPS